VNTVASDFIAELRADPELFVVANTIERALQMVDFEADANPDAAAMWEGISWILDHTERSAMERFRALGKLVNLEGKVRVNLREFLGWDTN
jgi:TolB-like protein